MKLPSLLYDRDARILLIGRTFGFFANRFLDFAIPWMVYQLTDSALLAGIVLAIDQLGPVIFSIPSGAIIEKMRKKKVTLIAELTRSIICLIMAVLLFNNVANIWVIALLVGVLGASNLFFGTSYNLFLMKVVGRNKLEEAFNLTEAIDALASSIAPAMAGVIFVVYGQYIAFTMTSLFFLISFFTILSVSYNEIPNREFLINKNKKKYNWRLYFDDVFKGIRYIFQSDFQRRFLFIDFAMGFVAMSMVLVLTVLAQDVLNLSAEKGSLFLTAMGIGAIFGVIILSFLHNIHWRRKLPLSLLISSFGLFLIAIFPSFYITLLGAFILDMGLSMAFVIHASAHQINTKEEYLARVNTSRVAFDGLSRSSSRVVTGTLVDLTDVRIPIFLFSGLLLLASKSAKNTKSGKEE